MNKRKMFLPTMIILVLVSLFALCSTATAAQFIEPNMAEIGYKCGVPSWIKMEMGSPEGNKASYLEVRYAGKEKWIKVPWSKYSKQEIKNGIKFRTYVLDRKTAEIRRILVIKGKPVLRESTLI